MEELFCKEETYDYFNDCNRKLREEIAGISDQEILTCNIKEWNEYLYNKHEIVPIALDENSKSESIERIEIAKFNVWSKYSPYEPEYFNVDGVRITYAIPFDGETYLWYLKPHSFYLVKLKADKISKPSKDKYGEIEISFEFTDEELNSQGDQMQQFVQKRYENAFQEYRDILESVNEDVNYYNQALKQVIQQLLEERKSKAASYNLISKRLEIPLNESKNMPNIRPIPLERKKRVVPNRPKGSDSLVEPYISDEQYQNINDIIYMNGTTMEKTARTYYKNGEEELRDHLLATLNTHYENATGETFRKIGKTDIQIEFDNKAAYIGECKIWHGKKKFGEAVQQVLNYSTWRDVKVSVIIFNKDNKSFQNVMKEISAWVEENTKSYKRLTQNVWNCDYYREDMQINIKLNISAFDLYVDPTQFKDKKK